MNSTEGTGGLFRSLLGRRGAQEPGRSDEAPSGSKAGLTKQGRRILLDAISDFLLDNELEPTADNLVIAQGVFSGANPPLARQIAARSQSGEKITQEWLDEVAATQAAERADAAIDRLMGKIEKNLDAFAKTSKAARTATADYGGQLEQHVIELEQSQAAGDIISNIVGLAKEMAERTRKLEQHMRKSEDEAKSLRVSLDRARRDAEIDHLTGLPNRRAFEALLDREYRTAKAEIDALCVAFCDIDHFKKVNDTHGHDTGDRVIKAIGELLARISNDRCHVARQGGEEFVMLFRGLGPSEAKARLDQVREEMASRNLINRKTEEPIGQITFSGGVADVFGYPDPRAALSAADEALYRAKQSGRNRIEIA